jgi:hypothetical protein
VFYRDPTPRVLAAVVGVGREPRLGTLVAFGLVRGVVYGEEHDGIVGVGLPAALLPTVRARAPGVGEGNYVVYIHVLGILERGAGVGIQPLACDDRTFLVDLDAPPVPDEGVVAHVATAVRLVPPKLRAVGCPVREILSRVACHASHGRNVEISQRAARFRGRSRHRRAGCRRRARPGRRFARATGPRILPEQLPEELLRTDRARVQPVAQNEHDDQNPDSASPLQIPPSPSNGHLQETKYATRRGARETRRCEPLALPLLLLAHWLLRSENRAQEIVFKTLALMMVGLLFVVVASALQRMYLYTSIFGLTELRLYTTTFMIWISVVLVWFVLTVMRSRRDRFVFGALVAGLAAILAIKAIIPTP